MIEATDPSDPSLPAAPARRRPLSKADLVARREELLRAGSLSPGQVALVLAGAAVPGLLTQYSSGSSGGVSLALPKSQRETEWLVARLVEGHRRGRGEGPRRVALVGGISHGEVKRVPGVFPGAETRSFALAEWPQLLAFDPDLLSCYPSVARDHLLRSAGKLPSLATIKLGGEPTLESDRSRLLERFPGCTLLEQFGSTEMPGLAFRATTRADDTGYELRRDRYDYRFGPPDPEGWCALEVRDRLPGRAFPIPGYYRTGDEVRRAGDLVLELRRAGDPANALRRDLDALCARGLHGVQALLADGVLLHAGPLELGGSVRLGQVELTPRRGAIYRLRDSNKAPLALNTSPCLERYWREGPQEHRA